MDIGLTRVLSLLLGLVRQEAAQGRAQEDGGGILTLGNVSLTNASLMFEQATLRSTGHESSDIHEVQRIRFEVQTWQLLQLLATSKSWAHSGFTVSRQLACEHSALMSQFCSPHKAWV